MINIGTVYTEINRAEAEGLFAEAELRMKAGIPADPTNPGSEGRKETREIIAARLGISVKPVQQAITIKRKRPDLYQRLFNGYDDNGKEVKIGTVYAQMKRGCSGYTIPHRLTPSAGRGKASRPSLSSSFAA
ncbi:hypothetical protein [Brevibacillus borstelensis]|uniref:hypothetical protein n=1 Tax=Brevibacillus borstelensis TaxID=45462 RepID=UPI001561FE94|nr:hypothetical protein [Brevibacillus borstelensis]MBE5396675.1 hypothetical protein [Brevibacillus borstelensis]WNF06371.1 hypothetical protein RFB14_02715 [Brevibacillus borstelensis]